MPTIIANTTPKVKIDVTSTPLQNVIAEYRIADSAGNFPTQRTGYVDMIDGSQGGYYKRIMLMCQQSGMQDPPQSEQEAAIWLSQTDGIVVVRTLRDAWNAFIASLCAGINRQFQDNPGGDVPDRFEAAEDLIAWLLTHTAFSGTAPGPISGSMPPQ